MCRVLFLKPNPTRVYILVMHAGSDHSIWINTSVYSKDNKPFLLHMEADQGSLLFYTKHKLRTKLFKMGCRPKIKHLFKSIE